MGLSFAQANLGPTSAQELFFSGFLESLELFFFFKICAHSKRYRNLVAGIFEIQSFFGNIVLPFVIGLSSFFSFPGVSSLPSY